MLHTLNFWIGYLIGMFVGGSVGIIVVALVRTAADETEEAVNAKPLPVVPMAPTVFTPMAKTNSGNVGYSIDYRCQDGSCGWCTYCINRPRPNLPPEITPGNKK